MFAAGIVLLVAMTGLDQDMMQRNLSCATPRDSQKNIVLTAVSQIFVIFLFLVLGVLLYLYAGHTGLELPAKSDQVFSLVAVDGDCRPLSASCSSSGSSRAPIRPPDRPSRPSPPPLRSISCRVRAAATSGG